MLTAGDTKVDKRSAVAIHAAGVLLFYWPSCLRVETPPIQDSFATAAHKQTLGSRGAGETGSKRAFSPKSAEKLSFCVPPNSSRAAFDVQQPPDLPVTQPTCGPTA